VRETLKALARGVAFASIVPALASYAIRAAFIGRNRALEGSSQLLSLVPGLPGQYMRRAFLARTLAGCAPSAAVCFGTIFSKAGARIDAGVYIGPGCHIGLAHIERDVLIGAGVHVTSGRQTHGTEDSKTSIRDQPGQLTMVHIGAGAWIGSAAVVMADVGANSIVAAGAVVVSPIPESVVAAGVPAKVVRQRT
jgi:acetyltransferase-like isoleucine patch superfamily enzyme